MRLSATLPVNPPTSATVIVSVALLPCRTDRVDADGASVKLGGVLAATVRATVVVSVIEPEVPVMVTVDVPTVAAAAGRQRQHAGAGGWVGAECRRYAARQSGRSKSHTAGERTYIRYRDGVGGAGALSNGQCGRRRGKRKAARRGAAAGISVDGKRCGYCVRSCHSKCR